MIGSVHALMGRDDPHQAVRRGCWWGRPEGRGVVPADSGCERCVDSCGRLGGAIMRPGPDCRVYGGRKCRVSVQEMDCEILALCAAELVLQVLHELVGSRPDVTPEAGEVGQVQLNIDQDQRLGARHESASVSNVSTSVLCNVTGKYMYLLEAS